MPFAAFFDILGTSRFFGSLADDFEFDGDAWEYEPYKRARDKFHRGLEAAVTIAPTGYLFRAAFSDCAYLVYSDPNGFLLSVGIAMRWFYGCAPVQAGIGYGNFGLGKTIHSSDSRGTSTEASFFGSSLVRAHAAEACGHKGCRAFVHDSAASRLIHTSGVNLVYPAYDYMAHEEGDPRPPTLPATMITLGSDSRSGVCHELCFVGNDDTDSYLRRLEMLQRAFPPDPHATEHYEESRRAILHFASLRRQSNPPMQPTGSAGG